VVTTSATTVAFKWPLHQTAQLVVSIRRRIGPAPQSLAPPYTFGGKQAQNGHGQRVAQGGSRRALPNVHLSNVSTLLNQLSDGAMEASWRVFPKCSKLFGANDTIAGRLMASSVSEPKRAFEDFRTQRICRSQGSLIRRRELISAPVQLSVGQARVFKDDGDRVGRPFHLPLE
jgi:hypothetical protein